MRKGLIVLFSIFILIGSGNAFPHALSKNTMVQLNQTVNQWRIDHEIPGVAVSIILPNGRDMINLVSGTMTLTGKEKIKPQTLFQICSITKVYTAVLILKLEAEKKLSLSQTVGTWLPQYPKWRNVTIKQLLNMTSGIPSFSNDVQFNLFVKKHPTKQWSTTETINFVKDKPMLFKPGTRWQYSDINYVLLGMIIEKVTGKSYAQVLKQNILQPLNLSHTYYLPYEYPPNIRLRLAIGYSSHNKDVSNVNMSQAGAAGAIVASAQDTARFFYALFSGKLLSKAQMKEMLRPYSKKDGRLLQEDTKEQIYGLGITRWWIPEGYIWMKEGGFLGYFAQASILKKNNTVIVITASKWTAPGFRSMLYYLTPKLHSIVNSRL